MTVKNSIPFPIQIQTLLETNQAPVNKMKDDTGNHNYFWTPETKLKILYLYQNVIFIKISGKLIIHYKKKKKKHGLKVKGPLNFSFSNSAIDTKKKTGINSTFNNCST